MGGRAVNGAAAATPWLLTEASRRRRGGGCAALRSLPSAAPLCLRGAWQAAVKAVTKDAVLLWEKFRSDKKLTAEDRARHADAALSALKGQLVARCMDAKTSRVTQAAIKCAGDDARKEAFEELLPHLAELAKGRHGHFVVKRVLDYLERHDGKALDKALRRKTAFLLRQQYSADVVDHLYHLVSATRRREMLLELFGKEFVVFGDEAARGVSEGEGEAAREAVLPRLLAKASGAPARRDILRRTFEALAPAVEKGLVHSPLVHRWLAEFLPLALPGQRQELVEALAGANLLSIMHTADGAAAAAWVCARATPKQRKAIAKACKDNVIRIAANEHGARVLAALLCVLDDTALAYKALLAELRAEADAAVTGRAAGRALAAALLAAPSATSVGKDMLATFEACGVQTAATQGEGAGQGGDAGGDAQDDGDDSEDDDSDVEAEIAEAKAAKAASAAKGGAVSKKAGERRRRELLGAGGGGSKGVGAALCAAAARNVGALMRKTDGAGDVLLAMLTSESLLAACPEGVAEVADAIAEEATREEEEDASGAAAGADGGEKQGGENEGGEAQEAPWEPIRTHFVGSRLLRRLVAAPPVAGLSPSLAARVLDAAVADRAGAFAAGHGAKVVAALCASADAEVAARAAAAVRKAMSAGELEEGAVHGVSAEGGAKKKAKRAAAKATPQSKRQRK